MIITLQTLVFFRESLLNALNRLLRPYYEKFSLVFGRNVDVTEDEESDEQVFAEFDDERGVVFYPPMYLQRYAAVSDCLMEERWCGKLGKVVDLGYHDMSFIKYLKEVEGIKCILGVDLESIPLRCSMDLNLVGSDEYIPKRENPLEIALFKGNAADPDYRLIGCDAVIAIEMIEHMLPHDLDRLIHTVFGFIKPWVAIFTTPNGDFNILFKSMEKNGLRRLDHFFEWSQEQFHDWCSNIIVRYPQYAVSCKGIGPGPNGTQHLGCCSQMAVFVAVEYNKQQNLNLNSLALVRDSPSPNSINNLISSWHSLSTPNESNMIEPPQNIRSYSELYSEGESNITIVLTTPSHSMDTIPYKDQTSQCNLDSEVGRNYLMFDYEQMCLDVVAPRRNANVNNRVYDIEDVFNRLNCTTFQVNKFSKTTQSLMAKNKVDSLVHTREVVDEIRLLTKMLNFNKDSYNQLENGTHTWCNINWGENAPYWNEYYTVVKEYAYPFETKSEECRILDLISDEINRLIDIQFEDDFSVDGNKLEIPIQHLMKVVKHITNDEERVKDILEWNGYEVVNNVVIHSRLIVEYSSIGTQEDDTPDTEFYSDWDSTDNRSTTMSDGSTIVPDYHARCLRRALDQKVRKLRSMLTADEDITTELDRVVCRLMKLALRTSKGRSSPPPTKWMQCKLLDLLTLTEKAIDRRRRHFIESYPLKSINNDEKSQEMSALDKIIEDDTALRIVNKYRHLVQQVDGMEEPPANYRYNIDYDLEDDLTVSSAEFVKDYEFDERHSTIDSMQKPKPTLSETFNPIIVTPQGESKLERTQAWVEEDIEVVSYPDHDVNFDNSSIEMGRNTTKFTKYYRKRYKGKQCIELNCVICKKSHSKTYKQNRAEERSKENSKTKLVKKEFRTKSSNNGLGFHNNNKFVSVDHKTYKIKPRKKQQKNRHPAPPKPIPVSLVKLCHPELMVENDTEPYDSLVADGSYEANKHVVSHELKANVAATKQSLLIDIVTDNARETIALRRSIGTDADIDLMAFEDEMLIRSVSNTVMNDDNLFEKHDVATENVLSQTIFLYDINEPTTSKGIRHIGMDAQCGPDATVRAYSMLSATTSLTRVPKIFTAGIKIGDSTSDTKINSTDFGTSTNNAGNSYKTLLPRKVSVGIKFRDLCQNDADNSYKTTEPRQRSIGIKIKDSDPSLTNKVEGFSASPYSMCCATSSLTKMPQMFTAGIEFAQSTSDTKMKSTDCGSYSNSDTYSIILPTARSIITIKTKDSASNLPGVMECSTNTQELCDISNPLSHQNMFPKKTTFLKPIPKEETVIQYCGSNLPKQIECSTNTQKPYDKSNGSSPRPFGKVTVPKGKSVGFKIIDHDSNLPKKTECPTNTPNSYYDRSFASSPLQSFHETTMLNFNIPIEKSSGIKLKKSSYDISNASSLQPFSEETTSQKYPSGIKIIDSTSEFCASVGSNSFQNSDLQVISSINRVVGSPGRPFCKYVKPKLCNGGVQVHSYRDRQIVSEDIMYQGQWQKNRPKVLTKKKCFIPVVYKKIVDANLKNKAISKEKIQNKSLANSKENNKKNLVKRDVKSEAKKDVKSQMKRNVKPALKRDAKLETKNYVKSQIKRDFKPEQKRDVKSEVIKDVKSEVMKDVKSEVIKDVKSEVKKDVKPEMKRAVKSEVIDLKSEVKKDVPPEMKRAVKSELIDVKSEVKKDIKSEVKQDFKSEVISDVKSQERAVQSEVKEDVKLKVERHVGSEVNKDGKFESKKSLLSRKKSLGSFKDLNRSKTQQNQKQPAAVGAAKVKPFRNILKVPSKFAVSSVHTKNLKSPFIVKKPPIISNLKVAKDENVPRKSVKKNYIPSYLRQRSVIKKTDLNLSFDSAKSKIKPSKEKAPKILIRSKTEEIKSDLLKFQTEPLKPQYVVLRNEIEKKSSSAGAQQVTNALDIAKKKNASGQRALSPTSPNSSNCSSPCSIATVRAVSTRLKAANININHRLSVSSHTNNSGAENTTSDRNKKNTTRCKNAKVTPEKVFDNKENIPETSKQLNIGKKESAKIGKRTFMGQKQDVYVAHLKENSPLQSTINTLSKHKAQKSNLNIPKAESISEIAKSSSRRSLSPAPKTSSKIEVSSPTIFNNDVSEFAQTSNMVLVIEPQSRGLHSSADTTKVDNINSMNHRLVTNWIVNSDLRNVDSHSENMSNMRELLDKTLEFIDDPFDDTINTETVILSRENIHSLNMRISASLTNLQTIVATDENYSEVIQSDVEYILDRSFDTILGDADDSMLSLNDTRLTVTDLDVLSFKSITSESKISGYLSADNELSSSNKAALPVLDSTPMQDIFERRVQPYQPAQNTTGALANQAFSGFSIDVNPMSGDQPDLINFADSETGSLSMDVARQATSEELFISGRSSDSFESCMLDDDAVVPNWLFQIISQQQSALDELEPPAQLLVPLPILEPMYDDNGNMMEGPGMGAGAGDGRGMHSDHSQDSSGRGTSVSSSATSSGPQSEAVLIDPSAFAAQFELLRDAVESSVEVLANNAASANAEDATSSRQGPAVEQESHALGRGESRWNPVALPLLSTASDIDADVSSIGTDVPDSSDN